MLIRARRRGARPACPESIRHAVIDDVALARAVKGSGGTDLAGAGATGWTACGRTRGSAQLWRMVSRSAYAQLRHNPLLLVGTRGRGWRWSTWCRRSRRSAALLAGDPVAGWAGVLAWAVMTGTYLPMLRYYRQPLWLAPLLPFTAALYLLMTVDSAVQHYRGRGAAWKGRTYAQPAAAGGGRGGRRTARQRLSGGRPAATCGRASSSCPSRTPGRWCAAG